MVQLVEQDTLTEPGILLIARFLWFLPILCTTLKQCLVSLCQQVRHIKTLLLNIYVKFYQRKDHSINWFSFFFTFAQIRNYHIIISFPTHIYNAKVIQIFYLINHA